MIKYLGSKRAILQTVVRAIEAAAPGIRRNLTVLDPFSGTARVGHALKRAGHRVFAADHNAYAATLAAGYVRADAEDVLADAERLVAEFNRLARSLPEGASGGWFTEDYCVRSRYFQPKNGARIEAVREAIAARSLPPDLEAVMLVSLMEAADRVDSTTGVQMAYLKAWAPRAHNDLTLRVPDVLPRARRDEGGVRGRCEAERLDALEAVERWSGEADVTYLDPPYNQHSYLGNYHVWETLARWDRPAVYGVACKRVDCRERQSRFNSRRRFEGALRELVEAASSPSLVVSFSDEGYVSREWMEGLLGERGHVAVVDRDYKRYVGAQIGIYSPRGEKVGKVSHLRNTEHVFIVTPEPMARDAFERLASAGAAGARSASEQLLF